MYVIDASCFVSQRLTFQAISSAVWLQGSSNWARWR